MPSCAKMSAQVAVSRACPGSLVGAVDPFVRGLKSRGGKNCIARVRTQRAAGKQGGTAVTLGALQAGKSSPRNHIVGAQPLRYHLLAIEEHRDHSGAQSQSGRAARAIAVLTDRI